MSDFEAHFHGQHEIDVVQPATGHRWHFLIATKGPGKRRLDGPVGVTSGAPDYGHIMTAVHEFAHAQALKAGRIDQ